MKINGKKIFIGLIIIIILAGGFYYYKNIYLTNPIHAISSDEVKNYKKLSPEKMIRLYFYYLATGNVEGVKGIIVYNDDTKNAIDMAKEHTVFKVRKIERYVPSTEGDAGFMVTTKGDYGEDVLGEYYLRKVNGMWKITRAGGLC